jgi:hypothetical protein
MKIINAILALFALCPLTTAQTKPDPQLPANVRLYEPKNLTPDRAERVAIFVRNLMNTPGVSWDNVPHAFVIRGDPQQMDMAEALLKRFDVPEPKVELTVYLIRASTAPASVPDPRLPSSPTPTPVPPELKSAIDEMTGAFKYDHYSLWDAILLQPKGNGGEVQGILPNESGAKNYVYTVGYRLNGAISGDGKTLNLASFSFSLKMPQVNLLLKTPQIKEDVDSHIQTEVTIREGQKLVLGKIRLLPAANADLFLVLSTKVY